MDGSLPIESTNEQIKALQLTVMFGHFPFGMGQFHTRPLRLKQT